LCFIGTGISLSALAALDPEPAIMKPALFVMVLTLFTLMFLLLAFRLFQPINEIVKMVNGLYNEIMVDEELEPAGAGTKTERQQLGKLTQQVKELKEEITVLKKKKVSSIKERDWFWKILILKWASVIVLICLVMFIIIPNQLSVFLTVVGIIGITIIALAHARNKNRLKRSKGDEA